MLNANNEEGGLLNSARNAFAGLAAAFKKERNFRTQIALGTAVIIVGFMLNVAIYEWLVLVLTIGWVLSLELVNTQVERLIDFFHPEHHPDIGKIKDMIAGAVLLSSVMAVVVALIIFLPKLM